MLLVFCVIFCYFMLYNFYWTFTSPQAAYADKTKCIYAHLSEYESIS